MIVETALSLGFDACGIAKADELTDDAIFMQSWLESGMHGDMHYLTRNFEKRIDPRNLVPGCKSVVVVLMNYYPEQMQRADAPKVAKYAYSQVDYHKVLKEKLQKLEVEICKLYGSDSVHSTAQHSFVDSAPVLERRWAERAGLGWIGKNTQLIHHGLGSYVFIGVLMLNVETEYNIPLRSRCGSCTRCIDACPTQALTDDGLDARRCISYLTIESKTDIPVEFQSKLSNCLVGCDICADVCPWNKKWAKSHSHPELASHPEIIQWTVDDWKNLKELDFSTIFKYSALKRASYSKIKSGVQLIFKDR